MDDPHVYRASSLSPLGAFLFSRGIPPAALLRRCDMPPIGFLDFNHCFSRSQALRLINTMGAMAGDPSAALRSVAMLRVGDFGRPDVPLLSAPDLGRALRLLALGLRRRQTGTRLDVRLEGQRVRLTLRMLGAPREDPGPTVEGTLYFVLRTLSLAGAGADVTVELPGQRPVDDGRHEPFFGRRLVYGGSEYALTFDRDLLAQPMPGAVRVGLAAAIGSPARHDRQDPSVMARRVLDLIREKVPRRRATLGLVAMRLGVAPRTLQRALDRWGMSFEEMVDDLRRVRALEALTSSQLPLAEIARLLGYSDPSHFTRAFFRWTGVTPTSFREAARPSSWWRAPPDSGDEDAAALACEAELQAL